MHKDISIIQSIQKKRVSNFQHKQWRIVVLGDVIALKVRVGNNLYDVEKTIVYQDDAIIGTITEPYIIEITQETSIENATITSAKVYGQDGMLIVEGANHDYNVFDVLGRLIYNGRETQVQLPTGVYVVQLGEEVQQVVL